MEAATKPVEYYDDEELDAYKGRRSDNYSDDEASEFADVLETLRPEDVKPQPQSYPPRHQYARPDKGRIHSTCRRIRLPKAIICSKRSLS